MADLMYIAIVVAFFAISALFTRACDNLAKEETDV